MGDRYGSLISEAVAAALKRLNGRSENMKEIKLRMNCPLDTQILSDLFGLREDLYLVWPAARHPFDHAQWEEVLDPSKGSLSFLVDSDGEPIGHCALLTSDEAGTFKVCFVYLKPNYRSLGLGREMIGMLEAFASRELDAKRLILSVRSYNPPAQRCYLKCGFKAYFQEETLIRMSKELS
jgi:RimJ/RimL family protein N-acetyltransferase